MWSVMRSKLGILGQPLVWYSIQKPSINFTFILDPNPLYFIMSSQPCFHCEVRSLSVVSSRTFRVEQGKRPDGEVADAQKKSFIGVVL